MLPTSVPPSPRVNSNEMVSPVIGIPARITVTLTAPVSLLTELNSALGLTATVTTVGGTFKVNDAIADSSSVIDITVS